MADQTSPGDDVVQQLRKAADPNSALPIGAVWNMLDEVADTIEDLRSRVAELDAECGDQRAEHAAEFNRRLEAEASLQRLRAAGRGLANCAFNLSQRNPGQFTTRDIVSLDQCRREWDAAMQQESGSDG